MPFEFSVSYIYGPQKIFEIRENSQYADSNCVDYTVDAITPLVCHIRQERKTAKMTIIYCRRHNEVAEVYEQLKQVMGSGFTDPPGAPNIPKYRLIDMYTSCTENSLKEEIVSSFVQPESRLRVVVATITFGMGLDCPNVHQVIHWGPANDIDSYVQHTGRTGRDGKLSVAILYFTHSDKM